VNDYITVFDLAQAGYRQWPYAAFGLIFVGIGVVLVRYRRRLPRGPKWFPDVFPYGFLGYSVLWTAIAFATTYAQYHHLRRVMSEGRAAIVEGPVENFVPMPYTGHGARESFTVGGARFQYSDYHITAGFNNTSSHGGPVRAGRLVRIAHVGGDIVRLEVHR